MANRQTLENLRGEIAFRRKLAVQHTTGQMLLPGYYDKASHDDILRERIETTRATFESLRGRGVNFARFVELGAERCHRSLVLCNQFGASGIAMDLSLDQLLTAGHFARLFGLPELPMRVCCDAGNLPLRSGVAPFVFCYQFLHHFPSLDGVLGEVRRVLGRGWFFFDEEPVGRWLQLRLYKQRLKEYDPHRIKIPKLLRWLEGFISEAASDEVEHGILENHAMPLRHWRENLLRFDAFDVRVRTLRHIRGKVRSHPTLMNLPALLLGGVIFGLAEKHSPSIDSPSSNQMDWLGCPCCWRQAGEPGPRPLTEKSGRLACAACGETFPVVQNVPILIEPSLRRALYPEYD